MAYSKSSSGGGIKEIYALRRKFKETNDQNYIEEAMELATDLVSDNFAGKYEWTAFGYCLVSLYFSKHRDKDDASYSQYLYECAKALVTKMEHIYKEDPFVAWAREDEYTKKQASYIRRILDECQPEGESTANPLHKARQLSKDKTKNVEAYQCYLEAQQQGLSFSSYDESSFAWTMYQLGRDLTKESLEQSNTIVEMLDRYLELKQIKKPSVINNCMLRLADSLYAANVEGFNFIDYVMRFDLNTLDKTAFVHSEVDNRTFDGMACMVLCHAVKNLFETRDESSKELLQISQYLEPFFSRAEQDEPSNLGWLCFYHARLLQVLNHEREAFEYAFKACHQLQSYNAAWHLLAECFSKINNESALQLAAGCYIKAMELNTQDKPIPPSTHFLMAEVLHKLQENDAAYNEISFGVQGYERKNRSVPKAYQDIVDSGWVKTYNSSFKERINLTEQICKKEGAFNELKHAAPFAELYEFLVEQCNIALGTDHVWECLHQDQQEQSEPSKAQDKEQEKEQEKDKAKAKTKTNTKGKSGNQDKEAVPESEPVQDPTSAPATVDIAPIPPEMAYPAPADFYAPPTDFYPNESYWSDDSVPALPDGWQDEASLPSAADMPFMPSEFYEPMEQDDLVNEPIPDFIKSMPDLDSCDCPVQEPKEKTTPKSKQSPLPAFIHEDDDIPF